MCVLFCFICVFYLLVLSADGGSLFFSVILVSADGATEGMFRLLLKPRKFDVCVLPIPCADEFPKTFVADCIPAIREEGGLRRERERVGVSKRLDVSEL